jgi:hypothetical protein
MRLMSLLETYSDDYDDESGYSENDADVEWFLYDLRNNKFDDAMARLASMYFEGLVMRPIYGDELLPYRGVIVGRLLDTARSKVNATNIRMLTGLINLLNDMGADWPELAKIRDGLAKAEQRSKMQETDTDQDPADQDFIITRMLRSMRENNAKSLETAIHDLESIWTDKLIVKELEPHKTAIADWAARIIQSRPYFIDLIIDQLVTLAELGADWPVLRKVMDAHSSQVMNFFIGQLRQESANKYIMDDLWTRIEFLERWLDTTGGIWPDLWKFSEALHRMLSKKGWLMESDTKIPATLGNRIKSYVELLPDNVSALTEMIRMIDNRDMLRDEVSQLLEPHGRKLAQTLAQLFITDRRYAWRVCTWLTGNEVNLVGLQQDLRDQKQNILDELIEMVKDRNTFGSALCARQLKKLGVPWPELGRFKHATKRTDSMNEWDDDEEERDWADPPNQKDRDTAQAIEADLLGTLSEIDITPYEDDDDNFKHILHLLAELQDYLDLVDLSADMDRNRDELLRALIWGLKNRDANTADATTTLKYMKVTWPELEKIRQALKNAKSKVWQWAVIKEDEFDDEAARDDDAELQQANIQLGNAADRLARNLKRGSWELAISVMSNMHEAIYDYYRGLPITIPSLEDRGIDLDQYKHELLSKISQAIREKDYEVGFFATLMMADFGMKWPEIDRIRQSMRKLRAKGVFESGESDEWDDDRDGDDVPNMYDTLQDYIGALENWLKRPMDDTNTDAWTYNVVNTMVDIAELEDEILDYAPDADISWNLPRSLWEKNKSRLLSSMVSLLKQSPNRGHTDFDHHHLLSAAELLENLTNWTEAKTILAALERKKP